MSAWPPARRDGTLHGYAELTGASKWASGVGSQPGTSQPAVAVAGGPAMRLHRGVSSLLPPPRIELRANARSLALGGEEMCRVRGGQRITVPRGGVFRPGRLPWRRNAGSNRNIATYRPVADRDWLAE
jgi:hypothetical protein